MKVFGVLCGGVTKLGGLVGGVLCVAVGWCMKGLTVVADVEVGGVDWEG